MDFKLSEFMRVLFLVVIGVVMKVLYITAGGITEKMYDPIVQKKLSKNNEVDIATISIGSKVLVGFNKLNSDISIPFWYLES